MKFTYCPKYDFSSVILELSCCLWLFLLSIHKTRGLTLSVYFAPFCVAPAAGSPCSSLRAHWPHGRMTVSLHYVCAKHQGLHNVKYRNTPPMNGARVDYSHALGYCNKRHFVACCCAAAGFRLLLVTQLRTIGCAAVKVFKNLFVWWVIEHVIDVLSLRK